MYQKIPFVEAGYPDGQAHNHPLLAAYLVATGELLYSHRDSVNISDE